MFGLWKKKSPPESLPSNPGIGVEARVAFANGDRSWTEEVNLVKLAESALRGFHHAVRREKTWLEHPESGYVLLPQLVNLEPLDEGGVRTVTTIQVNHPTLVPCGVFEYQHSAGDNLEAAIREGFDQWVQTDFVSLLDARLPKPGTCMAMQLELPAQEGRPARMRRAVLGPVAHFQQQPAAAANESCQRENGEDGGEHSFCPCCLLTRSFEAFKELFEGEAFYALRLYAARFEDGVPMADCRVNGEDWERGAEALRKYVETWPEAGVEFRKQYVVLHTLS